MLPAQPNQSLIDGLACLQAVAGAREPVGVRELARTLGLDVTRVNRLLRTLAHLGMTEQTAERKYVAGPGIHVLAAQSLFASGLIRRAVGLLGGLHRHGLIVALGVLWRDQVSYLYHAEPDMPVAAALGRQGLFPATRSSIGLALLAHQKPDAVVTLYRDREIPGFPRGVRSLQAELKRIRKTGVAHVHRGNREGWDSLAVTIGQPPIAAVALSGVIEPDREAGLVADLRRVADEVQPGA